MNDWSTEKPAEPRLKFPFTDPGEVWCLFFTYKKGDIEASKGSQCSWQWGISLLENILSSPSQFYKTEQKAKPGYENWETGTVLNIYIFFQFFSRVEPSCGASGSHIETEVQTVNNIVQVNHILPLSFLRGMQRDDSCRVMMIFSCWERNREQRAWYFVLCHLFILHYIHLCLWAEVAANSPRHQQVVLRKQWHEEPSSVRQREGGNSLALCQSFAPVVTKRTPGESLPLVLEPCCSFDWDTTAVLVGWFAFGVRAGSRQKGQLNRFSKYPTHHLKYEEGTLTLVSHDSIRCFLPVIWSNILTAVMSKLLQIQWAMGFTEPWGRTLGASWECYCWSVVAVLIVWKFHKHGLFWIDFSLGMAGILIFIQNQKFQHAR